MPFVCTRFGLGPLHASQLTKLLACVEEATLRPAVFATSAIVTDDAPPVASTDDAGAALATSGAPTGLSSASATGFLRTLQVRWVAVSFARFFPWSSERYSGNKVHTFRLVS